MSPIFGVKRKKSLKAPPSFCCFPGDFKKITDSSFKVLLVFVSHFGCSTLPPFPQQKNLTCSPHEPIYFPKTNSSHLTNDWKAILGFNFPFRLARFKVLSSFCRVFALSGVLLIEEILPSWDTWNPVRNGIIFIHSRFKKKHHPNAKPLSGTLSCSIRMLSYLEKAIAGREAQKLQC